MISDYKDLTPVQMRHLIREGKFTEPTSGLCPGYAQANLIILRKEHAYDFLLFAQRNPKACPVLEVLDTGSRFTKFVAKDCDIAKDFPNDLVGFLIGCSFSFESEMIEAGIEMRHNTMGRNVPMYITGIDTVPAGVFSGKMVVSMRPVPPQQVVKAVTVTAQLPKVHGSPIHIGDPSVIGIKDINNPEFGDPVEIKEGEVTMFWPCGVTPQSVVMNVKPDFAITHAPGHMLILDVKNVDLKE